MRSKEKKQVQQQERKNHHGGDVGDYDTKKRHVSSVKTDDHDEDDHASGKNDNDRFDTRNKPQFRDSRSSRIQDPYLQSTTKVELDDRFASVLTDPRFQLEVRDRYGRDSKKMKQKKKKTRNQSNNASKEQLSAFYSIKDNNEDQEKKQNYSEPEQGPNSTDAKNETGEDDEQASNDKDGNKNQQQLQKQQQARDDDMVVEDQKYLQDPSSRIAYLTALSRGELDVSSSSSEDEDGDEDDASSGEDDENDSDEEDEVEIGILDPSYHHAAEQNKMEADLKQQQKKQQEVDLTNESSKYLAILNMDWSHVRAVDIYAIVSSFVAPGAVEKVQVYPSDFGMEQMEKETQFGPSSDLWKKSRNNKKNKNRNDPSRFNDMSDDEKDENSDSDEEQSGSDEDGSNSSDGEDQQAESDDDAEDNSDNYPLEEFIQNNQHDMASAVEESDFDPEKLRAYEASRLKYYFAVVSFTNESQADIAYREVDGLEFEHSSAAIDVRAIPPSEIGSTVKNRKLRDEATSLPSNYVPPDFVVKALQQTNVTCTWEAGDPDRERVLTKYGASGRDWKDLAESDDLKAYLASDVSSDDEEEEVEEKKEEDGNESAEEQNAKNGKSVGGRRSKAARMRQMLGLDDDENHEDVSDNENDSNSNDDSDNNENASSNSADSNEQIPENDLKETGKSSMSFKTTVEEDEVSDDDDDDNNNENDKEFRYIPGSKNLAEKLRSKMKSSSSKKELTPWEQYQEKRREKKKEKKRQAREKREEVNRIRRGKAGSETTIPKATAKTVADSSFLIDDDDGDDNDLAMERMGTTTREKRTVMRPEELELLVAGDDTDEVQRDFDMRGLQRIEKNKIKKLRGARKRTEEQLAAGVTGTNFQMDLTDDRFQAVLDGQDDRFGIDRTNPQFQDTPAMRQVLAEQQSRRKKQRRRKQLPQKSEEEEETGFDDGEPSWKRSKLEDNVSTSHSKTNPPVTPKERTATEEETEMTRREKHSAIVGKASVRPEATTPASSKIAVVEEGRTESSSKKRKKKKNKRQSKEKMDSNQEEKGEEPSGAMALSALMSQYRTKHDNNNDD